MITKIEILADDVRVHFNGENSEIFPNIWLRDHAKDEQNWDKRSSQRKTYTAALDINLKVNKAEIIENGKYLSVSWPDLEKPVKYSSEFLTNNKRKKKKEIKSNLKIWKSNEIKKGDMLPFFVSIWKELLFLVHFFFQLRQSVKISKC